MSVSKDSERGTYSVRCRHKDWIGESKKKTKRGFETEKEVRKWEYEFLKGMEGAPTMLSSEFYEVYVEDTTASSCDYEESPTARNTRAQGKLSF